MKTTIAISVLMGGFVFGFDGARVTHAQEGRGAAGAAAQGQRGVRGGPAAGRGRRGFRRGGAADASAPDNAPRSIAPYFTPAASSPKAVDSDGFVQRWLLLEPIAQSIRSNAVFTESYVRNAFTTEHFPDQFTVVPRDGDKVTVGGEELLWHALDSANFNVKLFRFAYGLDKPTYGVLFWAVTVVNCPRETPNIRLAVGSNSASMWWLNGEEAVDLFGDRRMVVDDCVSKRLTLQEGRNVIRGAVINGPGLSDFCVRFIDENGQPIKDLTQSLESAEE